MKFSFAILSAAIAASPVLARGRNGNGNGSGSGKNGSSKGSSSTEVCGEFETGFCPGAVTTVLLEEIPDPNTPGDTLPILSLEEAVRRVPLRQLLHRYRMTLAT